LDLKAAYETVWYVGLLLKLLKILPHWTVDTIAPFLRDRHTNANKCSSWRLQRSDVTQPSGAPLTFSGRDPLRPFLSVSPPTSGGPFTRCSSHPIVTPLLQQNGLHQGAVLSRCLFNSHTNDLPSILLRRASNCNVIVCNRPLRC